LRCYSMKHEKEKQMAKKKYLSQKKIYVWHKKAGVYAMLFLVMLAVTGVMLNRAELLGLKDVVVDNPAVLRLYGMQPKGDVTSFAVGANYISSVDNAVYYGDKKIGTLDGTMIGAVKTKKFIVVATATQLHVFSTKGEAVEKIGAEALPAGSINAIGVKESATLLKTQEGIFEFDADMVNWKKVAPTDFIAAAPTKLPTAAEKILLKNYRGEGLPLDRVILDIHSGRFFGKHGPLVMDLSALALIFLALTGLVNVNKNAKRKRKKHHGKSHHG
jgi:hypothetical protein